ncbi:ABC transporter substrate-binding protein [Clostridium uliginosum]|uniref:Iron complex transport system substrate-binding protein n=1 Tax=Clostridium uliginosum TaxID=119641 RepID=A0A1I1Q936_9CLOT|nr:ABC transporter substrate-binding protein [Clostridium uliginosum]SFD16348.1 iron complex transport system substrate-binding protein [Clostridium uliginosum]
MKLRNKFLSVVFIAILTMTMLVGCGAKTAVMTDREGNEFNLPKKVNTIISTAPSNTEALVALGLSDKLIAIDKYSADVEGVSEELPKIDFRNPDAETIVGLKPDIIIASGHNKSGNEDPFAAVKEAGIEVVYIPSSSSIEGIYADINFIAKVTGVEKKGIEIVDDMKKEINSIKEIGDKITDKKNVYFEIGSTPSLFSFGNSTFLNEMIELTGAENILANETGWISPSSEVIVKANPDVILTNEAAENIAQDIKTRDGWSNVTAVKENNIFVVDKNSSSRPSQKIIKALKEMAKAIYPEKYE